MGPEVSSERMLRGLRRELRLSPEQARAIEPLIEKRLGRMHEIRMAARPEIGEELRAMNEEIMSVLDEEQQEMWMRRLERMERELRPGFPVHRRGGRGPGQRGRGERMIRRRGPGGRGVPSGERPMRRREDFEERSNE